MATFYQSFSSRSSPPKLYVSYAAKGKSIAISKFRKILYNSAFLHLSFSLFLIAQVFLLTTLMYTSHKSVYTAASLAILFFSFISYTLISFYQKNKKLNALDNINKEFIRYCTVKLSKNITNDEDLHLAIAECSRDLSDTIQDEELFYLNIYPFKFSRRHIVLYYLYFHYNDFIYLKEKALNSSINCHMKIIENSACSLEFHSSLSKTYTSLANCYKKPNGKHLEKAYLCAIVFKKHDFQNQMQKYYTLASEELIILCELSNYESWTLLELATLYSHFGDSEKEMKQYELFLEKITDDKEIIYKLGTLYFRHKKTSKALKMYKLLQKLDATYAKNLLMNYRPI